MGKDSVSPQAVTINVNVLNFSILSKLQSIDLNGENIIDFTQDVVDLRKVRYEPTPVLVTAEFNGRPDLLSEALYDGVADYADILCYVNGISNPFTLEEGMILKVPILSSLGNAIATKEATKKDNKAKEFLLKKLPQKDKDRLTREVENGDIRTPNLAKDGNSPFAFNPDGSVSLGQGITTKKCKDDLSPSQLVSEKIRKAVQDKLVSGEALSQSFVSFATQDSLRNG